MTRVEAVADDAFTTVMRSQRGRTVRADQHLVECRQPTVSWCQDLEGTPFERILRSARTSVTVDAAGEGSLVTVALDRRPRGMARFGGLLLRRAARGQLDEALDALERIVA